MSMFRAALAVNHKRVSEPGSPCLRPPRRSVVAATSAVPHRFPRAFFIVPTAFLMLTNPLDAEDINVHIVDIIDVSKETVQGNSVQLSYNDAVSITLDPDIRFIQGIELELNAPQIFLNNQGSLAAVIYSKPDKTPVKGSSELSVTQINMNALENKIQTIYKIPVKKNHNLKSTPYAIVLSSIVDPQNFPVVFRIIPIIREMNEELRNMRFQLTVKPILSNEGAVKINIRYPPTLQNKPYTTLIDDTVIEHPEEERFLKEGEHHLMLISNDYRNESRRFILERGKTMEINLSLQDLTPLIFFETPDNAKIFLDNIAFSASTNPKPIEAGPHEIKIQVSDYTIIKSVYIRKGKTYRISFTVNLDVSEED
ncbi:MAG: hypothetical protein LBV68_08900 [Spirochaetaceae bacterium]|nr:hypothetical protein [Spirochaetaceae bacterium]